MFQPTTRKTSTTKKTTAVPKIKKKTATKNKTKTNKRTQQSRDYYGSFLPASKLTPTQQLHRQQKTARSQARRQVSKTAGALASSMDVDHLDGNPLNNKPANLSVTSAYNNRAKGAIKANMNMNRPVFHPLSSSVE